VTDSCTLRIQEFEDKVKIVETEEVLSPSPFEDHKLRIDSGKKVKDSKKELGLKNKGLEISSPKKKDSSDQVTMANRNGYSV
jgi:hypothetical protein